MLNFRNKTRSDDFRTFTVQISTFNIRQINRFRNCFTGKSRGSERVVVNPGIGERVMAVPRIDVIATGGWSVPISMEDRPVHVWALWLEGGWRLFERWLS